MRKIISLILFLSPAWVFAASPDARPELRSDAPDQHVVVKGDTLWDISARFFKDPWKWQYIWGMNKDSINDPHWIYPGEVIVLDRASGVLRVGGGVSSGGTSARATGSDVLRLSPRVRAGYSDHDAVPTIPFKDIAPFLGQPLVVGENELKNAPALLGAREKRVILGTGDTGFAHGLTADKGSKWQLYRPGKTLVDPDTKEVLGVEAIYLGNAEVTHFADVSTIFIRDSVQEILKGDRLVAAPGGVSGDYHPRAPEKKLSARIISVYGGVSQAGQNAVVVLNKGKRDGLEDGHVLALHREGETIKDAGKEFTLPDERYGLLLVFRTFDKVSYALVMESRLPSQLLDLAQTP